jgi:pimeloyl-ACP methyl ester carboxylesterase
MVRYISTILASIFTYTLLAANPTVDTANTEIAIKLETTSGTVHGTLLLPAAQQSIPVALIIAGSGPTDRNGNNPMMKNESLRLLAQGLYDNQIASLRFDKRGIGESQAAGKAEADLRLEDNVDDVKQWIALLKKDKRFSKVYVIGHSEGSLIGMIATHHNADGFVSIAGLGKPANVILKEQLAQQPPMVKEASYPIIDSLAMGHTVKQVNPMLYSLFRPSVQPFLISWFRYNPQEELKKLSVPILVLQGTNDLQVGMENAQLLATANTKAQLVSIPNMNHVLKIVEEDKNANVAAYSDPTLPIASPLIDSITAFIKTGKASK